MENEKVVDPLTVAPEEFEGELTEEQQKDIDEANAIPFDEEAEEPKKPLETEEEEESEEPGKEKKPDEEEKPKEEGEELTDEQKAEAELKKFAEEEGITVDEAKEIIEKDKAIVERHGNDPIKIARALRKENSAYGKLNNEVEGLRKFKSEIETKRQEFSEKQFLAAAEANKDKIIDIYVSNHPEESDESEDTLFERAKVEARQAAQAQSKQVADKITKDAAAKRAEVVETLPEQFNDVKTEVKEFLEKVEDKDMISSDFNLDLVVAIARGKKYTPEHIKSLEDAAYKRGLEQPEIKRKNAIGNSETRGPGKGAPKVAATEHERDRAIQIYGMREGWTEDQMVAEYMKNDKGKDFDD